MALTSKLKSFFKAKVLLVLALVFTVIGYSFYDPHDPVIIDPRYTDIVGTKEYPLFELVMRYKTKKNGARRISWSKDGSRFAHTGSGPYTIWSRGGELLYENLYKSSGASAPISHDGKKLYLSRLIGPIDIVDIESNTLVNTIPHPDFGYLRPHVDYSALSEDGQYLIAAFSDFTIAVYDTSDWSLKHHIKDDYINATIAISPNNQHLAVGDASGQISIWDYISGKLIHKFKAHKSAVKSLNYNVDGSLLAVGAITPRKGKIPNRIIDIDALRNEGLVSVWSTRNWQRTTAVSEDSFRITFVYSVEVNPEDTIILNGSKRGFLQIHDMKNGQLIQQLPVDSVVQSMKFSPDGQCLAAVSFESVFLWKVVHRSIGKE